MWCSDRRAVLGVLAFAAVGAALGGCGFEPLYGAGTPAAEMLGRVAVAPLDGAAGFALRERLTERLGPAVSPTHRLEVDLELETTGVALTMENITTRFNVVGAAQFRLVPAAGGEPDLVGEVRAITGYSAPVSETSSAFAARSAELDAERRLALQLADLIVMRLALTAPEWGA